MFVLLDLKNPAAKKCLHMDARISLQSGTWAPFAVPSCTLGRARGRALAVANRGATDLESCVVLGGLLARCCGGMELIDAVLSAAHHFGLQEMRKGKDGKSLLRSL